MNTIEEILQEASAYNLRNEVKELAEKIKENITAIGLIDGFTDEMIYQEAFDTCTNPPTYMEYYACYEQRV